ncbi:lipid A biosynthesis acyltransferase [Flavobacterium supellecticarium]|uniref:Lipid A biosynthesis acyltransferase n=1 Tax=Flavobacterium supellecticarium TaxID=2565924 RepID=A0A4V3W8V4_9FLAO|nr:lysophospholipid acyltransferase family protein [Flavobacterium supellecticarium]THF52696.1 lipid A biosynthesis acyltransferase [Flavobacterium supellecticarium]
MQFILYIIAYPFLWCVSMLPFPVFYLLSDCIYFIVYHVIGYRKKTVRKNLADTLPHLSEQERRRIERKFFQHMCDMFLEMVKTMTISEAEMKKRFVFTNIELVQEMEKKNKSIIMMCAHYASWEWLIIIDKYINFRTFAVYKKIQNKYFDKLIRDIRSRFNSTVIEAKETVDAIRRNEINNIKGFYGFASDQSPQLHRTNYFDTFMGINVPVFTGAEMLAKKLDLSLVFVKVQKVKRGHYQATFVPLSENPKEVPNYEITSTYLRMVEAQIYEAPEFYLWTHKRWKHRDKQSDRSPRIKKALN